MASEGSTLLMAGNNGEEVESAKDVRPDYSKPTNIVLSFATIQVALVVLFVLFTKTDTSLESSFAVSPYVREQYQFMMHVSIMIFIGFGYLMTFLKKYGYGAVGFTFLVSVVAIEVCMLVLPFFNQLHTGEHAKIMLSVSSIIEGLFASAAVMISFGALLGKVGPGQMLFIATFEVIFYVLNLWIVSWKLQAVDMGGSIFIHTFGAYFGLAASLAFKRVSDADESKPYFAAESNAYYSDLFSFIGTVFLWIYWPSFNGAVASPTNQIFTTMNTFLSLCASNVTAFFLSRLVRQGTFDTADIQNATLAGGVAIGTASNMPINPGVAMIIGTLAGAISILGYRFLQPKLQTLIGLHDTCGVHNLHGMPGVLGGIFSAIAVATLQDKNAFPHTKHQAGYQLLAVLITVGFASASGAICGYLAQRFLPSTTVGFNDAAFWAVPVADTAYTTQDSNRGLKVIVPMRNSLAVQRWGGLRKAIKTGSLRRAMLAAAKNTSNGYGSSDPSTESSV